MEVLSAKPHLRLLLDHLATIQNTRQSWKVAYARSIAIGCVRDDHQR
jgi:hypothetical protein